LVARFDHTVGMIWMRPPSGHGDKGEHGEGQGVVQQAFIPVGPGLAAGWKWAYGSTANMVPTRPAM
jgi:hypothetical protein